MQKKLNILTRHRIKMVIAELCDIQEDSKLNKIDSWNLEQAIETLVQILEVPKKNDPEPKGPPNQEIKDGEVE